MPGMSRLHRLAAFAHRRRRLVLAGWLVLLVAVLAVAPRIAGEFSADYSSPGSDSHTARDIVSTHFGGFSAETIDVVWEAPGGAAAPAVSERLDRFVYEAERLEGIASAQPPQVSRDGTIALARLQLDRPPAQVPIDTAERLIDDAEEASRPGLEVALAGGPIREAEGGPPAEVYGLLGAMVVLLIAFGSLVAMGLPLAVALFGLGVSAPLIGVLSGVLDVPEWATVVAGLIGIGVGIDYALLVLTRFRAALDRGADTADAVGEAVATAGRSVLVAGGTVVISLMGLILMGLDYMNGVALSASLAVLVVMAASVTLLPALLSMAGASVNRLRVPFARGRRTVEGGGRGTVEGSGRQPHEGGGLATRWSQAVQRRPWTAVVAGVAVLLALTVPVTDLRFGFPDAGNDQPGTPTREAYDMTEQGFGPGATGPLLVAVEQPGPDGVEEMRAAAAEIGSHPGVARVSPPRLSEDGEAAMLTVTPRTSPQDAETEKLVHDLRGDVLPATLGAAGLDAYVGGMVPNLVDQSELVSERLPLFIAGVVGLSFLLLIAAFRAPVVALKAGLMNLLSVGAAYGVVALFAGGGFLGELIGIHGEVPVPPFVPVLMFAVLFGLSMDYEVFLLSRVREEYLLSGSTREAVTAGLARTARVITAAAAIMVVVFGAFVASEETFLRLIGVGMATAILVDATVIRMVLVPAVMQLLGRANWWMPRWMARVVPERA
jgi:putative drug exporter of the RND superfamily